MKFSDGIFTYYKAISLLKVQHISCTYSAVPFLIGTHGYALSVPGKALLGDYITTYSSAMAKTANF